MWIAEHKITNQYGFPIPRLEYMLDLGSSRFSKIDLRSGYHKMLDPNTNGKQHSKRKMAYKWLVMPKGLSNAPHALH